MVVELVHARRLMGTVAPFTNIAEVCVHGFPQNFLAFLRFSTGQIVNWHDVLLVKFPGEKAYNVANPRRMQQLEQ